MSTRPADALRGHQAVPNCADTGILAPHGGTLRELLVDPLRSRELTLAAHDWPSWDLTARQLCDLELLLNGAFSPLQGFLGRSDYESVCATMRLKNGSLWPMPTTLDVSDEMASRIGPGASIALRDAEGVMLAALHIEEIWQPDRTAEVRAVFGTTNRAHPGVAQWLDHTNSHYVAGRLEGIQLPTHYDFCQLRLAPRETRAEFSRLGWTHVAAFDPAGPMHRAEHELTLRAARETNANVLIHPVVGLAKPGDVNHYTRVRCYQGLLAHYPKNTVRLALLPLAIRRGGPREALWHAIVRKNYGCSHVIPSGVVNVGGQLAAKRLGDAEDALDMLRTHQDELDVRIFEDAGEGHDRRVDEASSTRGLTILTAEPRDRVAVSDDLAGWFTFPEVARELRRTHRPRLSEGFTVFMTGLSGSGKSTIANALLVKLLEVGGRAVTLLDGDVVRKKLSSELGFSKEHRDLNVLRIGYVASEITKNGGVAICAPIAPYHAARQQVRDSIAEVGACVLVYVNTPLEICELRDRKGLYAKARKGLLPQFTGISDPYEAPNDADVTIDTTQMTPEEAATRILLHLQRSGLIARTS